ncbi:MAG TPA: CbiQ family ECF transporter T component, partial [Dermatophilaceae bacterium]|nr:CbiQ family ECF transporter T component [Dermatophilaceae bacterium]
MARLNQPNAIAILETFLRDDNSPYQQQAVASLAELRGMAAGTITRGFDARSPRQWPVLATCLGALFVRSYERGERVHLAMLSRGYAGSLPVLDAAPLRVGDLVVAAALPTMAAVGMGAAVLTR